MPAAFPAPPSVSRLFSHLNSYVQFVGPVCHPAELVGQSATAKGLGGQPGSRVCSPLRWQAVQGLPSF